MTTALDETGESIELKTRPELIQPARLADEPHCYTLPFPPSVNHYWMRTKRGMMIGAKGVKFRADVLDLINRTAIYRPGLPLTGRLQVRVTLNPPDRRRRDLDNFNKGPLDALTHAGVYEDDCQIDRLIVERGEVTPGGNVVVEIRDYVPHDDGMPWFSRN